MRYPSPHLSNFYLIYTLIMSTETMLEYHLTCNFYPALSTDLVAPCLAAIALIDNEMGDEFVSDLLFSNRPISAYELASKLHLEPFLA